MQGHDDELPLCVSPPSEMFSTRMPPRISLTHVQKEEYTAMLDSGELETCYDDSPQFVEVLQRLTAVSIDRFREANELGQRADPPVSFPAVIMYGMIDELKAEYLTAIEDAKLLRDDARSSRRNTPSTLENTFISETAHNLSNCCLVHTSWYFPARNALGAVLRNTNGPLLMQFFNPVFGVDNTKEAHIQWKRTLANIDPRIELNFLIVKLQSLSHLDLDFTKFGSVPASLAAEFADSWEPSLQTLVLRGVKYEDKDALTSFLETPHTSLTTITFVFFDLLEFIGPALLAPTPDEALVPPSLSRSVKEGTLARFNVIEWMPIDVLSSEFVPHIAKVSCGRSTSGLFTLDEMAFGVNIDGIARIPNLGKLFIAQVRSLILECDSPAANDGEAAVKGFLDLTRGNLRKLHIRLRINITSPLDALSSLPTSVEELYITLTNLADRLCGLDGWDGVISDALERIPDGNLKTLHVSVSTSFGHFSMPKCEEWCAQKGIAFVGTLGGRNLYL